MGSSEIAVPHGDTPTVLQASLIINMAKDSHLLEEYLSSSQSLIVAFY